MSAFFRAKLRYLRQQHYLSQAELAEQLGFDAAAQSYLSSLEAGDKLPSLKVVIALAARFGLTTDYFLRDAIPITDTGMRVGRGNIKYETSVARLGEKLRFLRRRGNLAQKVLAQELGLQTQAHISHIESGTYLPSINLLLTIADHFEVSTDYLLCDSIPVDDK